MTIPTDIAREVADLAGSYQLRLANARKDPGYGLFPKPLTANAFISPYRWGQALRGRAIQAGATSGEIDAALASAVPLPSEIGSLAEAKAVATTPDRFDTIAERTAAEQAAGHWPA